MKRIALAIVLLPVILSFTACAFMPNSALVSYSETDESTSQENQTSNDGLNQAAAQSLTIVDEQGNVILDQTQITNASVYNDEIQGCGVLLQLNQTGKQLFAQATKANVGKTLSIYLDDQLLSSPTVVAEITDGQVIIAVSTSLAEAEELNQKIQSVING